MIISVNTGLKKPVFWQQTPLEVQSPENSSCNFIGEDKGFKKRQTKFILKRPHQVTQDLLTRYFNAFKRENRNICDQGVRISKLWTQGCKICASDPVSLGIGVFICRTGTKSTFWERRRRSSILDRLSLKEEGRNLKLRQCNPFILT